MSSTITSILDSVHIEKDNHEINESSIPAEIYEIFIQMKSIPFLKVKNMKNLKIKVRDLYKKAVELSSTVVKQNEEIKCLRKIKEDLNVKCNEKFMNLKDIDIAKAFRGTSYEARYDMIEWDKGKIKSKIKEILQKLTCSVDK